MWKLAAAYHAGYRAGRDHPEISANDSYHKARRFEAQTGAENGCWDSFKDGHADAKADKPSKY